MVKVRRSSGLLWWILGGLFGLGLVSAILGAWRSGDWDWWGFFLNLGTELIGAAVVYLLLSRVLDATEKREDLKRQLRHELGSSVKDVAVAAAEKLRREGWLSDGSLRRAFLEGANLEGADLYKANLWGAYLMNANLVGANLVGANLERAFLEGAELTGSELWDATYNNETVWPEGFAPPPQAINVDEQPPAHGEDTQDES